MAKPRELTDLERNAVATRVKRWDHEDRSTWADKARAVAKSAGEEVQAQTLRNALAGKAGRGVAMQLERYFGETLAQWMAAGDSEPPQRTIERVERYPSIAIIFARARMADVDEKVLDAARAALGGHRGVGPTEDEVQDAIDHEIGVRAKLRAHYKKVERDAGGLDNMKAATPRGRKRA